MRSRVGALLLLLAFCAHAGCGDAGRSSSAPRGVIKISTQSPLSGPQASLGEAIKLGAQFALETLGAPVREAGYGLTLVPFDDQAEPGVGLANARTIVADPDILLVIGHLNSAVAIPALQVYREADLALISPANTHPDITDRGYANVNRVVGRDDVEGAVAADFARAALGVDFAYVIHDGTPYGQRAAESFRSEAGRRGIRVAGFAVALASADYAPVIREIAAQDPDAVYFGGIFEDAALLFAQARAAGVRAAFLGPDGMDSPDLARLAGPAVVGLHYVLATGPVDVHPGAREFAAAYRRRFGKDAQPYSAEAYDAALLGLRALERAILDAGGERPTRGAVSAAIRQLRDVSGLTGSIEVDERGDRRRARYFVMRVESPQPELWHLNPLVKTIEAPPPGSPR